jgi:uncharacterized protein involved in exopolysaccharide biosynthesis
MDASEITRPSLRDVLHIVFKHKNHILLFFFATVCTVAVGTALIKPTYEATAQILIKTGRENIFVPTVPTNGNLNPVFSFNREEQINSEIEILKGQFLIEKVVSALGPTTIYESLQNTKKGLMSRFFNPRDVDESPLEKAVLRLQKDLEVEGVKKSDVIDIQFAHTNPHMAASVVNTLVNFYLDHHVNVHKNPQSYTFFKEQAQMLKNRLKQAEENLKEFKKQHNVTSIEEEKSLLLRQEADLRTALNQTISQEAEAENRIHQIRQQIAATPKNIPQSEEIEHSPHVINTLQARLVELEIKEKELLSKYTDQSRLVKSVRDEIQMVRERLATHEAKRYGRSRTGMNVTYQRLQEELFRNEAEVRALKAKKDTQIGQLSEYRNTLEKLNRIEVDLNELKHEIDMDRKNYRLYLTKFEESRISNAMDMEKIANVSLIEPARPPIKPVSPRVMLNMVIAVFMGSFGSLGVAFFMEYLDDSLEKTDDVEAYLEVPVLTSIPEMKK